MNRFLKITILSAAVAATTLTALAPPMRATGGTTTDRRDGDLLAAGVLGLAVGAIAVDALQRPGSLPAGLRRADLRRADISRSAAAAAAAPPLLCRAERGLLPGPAGLEPWSPEWFRYCGDRYRSFDPDTGTFSAMTARNISASRTELQSSRSTQCAASNGGAFFVRSHQERDCLGCSSPKRLPGPWPQMKPMSSPSGSSFSLIERISAAWSPPGRSVRPTEPRNSTSPTCAKLAAAVEVDDMARRMAGAMQHLERMLAERDGLAFAEEAVGRAVAHRVGQPEALGLGLQIGQHRAVGLVRADDVDAERVLQLHGAAGMVDMAMRDPDLRDVDAVVADRRKDAVDVAAGIDHHAVPWSRCRTGSCSSAGTG